MARPKSNSPATKPVLVRLTEEEHKALKSLAEKDRRTLGDEGAWIITDYIKQHADQHPEMGQ